MDDRVVTQETPRTAANPYSKAGPTHHAWNIGYEAGVEAAARQVTELRAAAHELLAALGRISGTVTGRDRLDAAETRLKVLLAGDKAAHEHEWTDARNGVVTSGEVCLCGAVRAGDPSAGDKAEAPPQDFGEQIVAESHLGRRIAGGQ